MTDNNETVKYRIEAIVEIDPRNADILSQAWAYVSDLPENLGPDEMEDRPWLLEFSIEPDDLDAKLPRVRGSRI